MTEQAKQTTLDQFWSLSEAFSRIYARRLSPAILQVDGPRQSFNYDFVLRIMYGSSDSITPFSQIDREVLVAARDKLIALGGHPPELTPEAPAPQATKGLRL
jgi:hypothetical protein